MRPTQKITNVILDSIKEKNYHPVVVYMTKEFYDDCLEDLKEYLSYPNTQCESLDEFMGLTIYVLDTSQYSEHPDFVVY